MLSKISTPDLLSGFEIAGIKILIPDQDVETAWDNTRQEYEPLVEADRALIRKVIETRLPQGEIRTTDDSGNILHLHHIFIPIAVNQDIQPMVLKITLDETEKITREKAKEKELESKVQRNIEHLSKINEISSMIHATLDLDEIINMVLVAATAGQGFRFNRAFLFLMNDDRTYLEGRKAIGPSDPHEAGLLWSELDQEQRSLKEILTSYKAFHDGRDFKVNQMIASLRIPVVQAEGEEHFKDYLAFYTAVHEEKSVLISPEKTDYFTPAIKNIFETEHLAIVPLISKDGVMGAIVVDNSITGRPISEHEVETLKIFGHQISAAVENAMLYDKLRKKVDELEEAHQSLKTSQERLIRSEKLAVVGELSAKMAHEIRNPLVSIGGFARAILKRPHTIENEPMLKVIVDETMRLETILNDTLSFIRTGHVRKTRQPIIPMIENALTLLNERFEENKIEVVRQFECENAEAEFDADYFTQVMLNIMINSIQAMTNGGKLNIKLQQLEKSILLMIEDTGEGMTQEELQRLFTPFYTTKQRGSGFGLTVVQEILDHHGFGFNIESEKGKGTTFTIIIPL